MQKLQVVKEIESIIGKELILAPPYPDVITGVMVVKKDQPKYAMEDGQLIGLNLAGIELIEGQLRDVFGIIDLQKIRGLNVSNNNLKKLLLPKQLQALEQLDISDNKELAILQFPEGLTNLKRLTINGCNLSMLHLPSNMDKLHFLQAQNSQIEEIQFEEALSNLETLDLSGNTIKKIDFKGGFQNLKYLFLKGNKRELSLSFQTPFPQKINSINLEGSNLKKVPDELVFLPNLEYLNLRKNVPKNIPKVFLDTNNCLVDAKDWFSELRDFPYEKNSAVKLMLTGNGDAGKTTVVCSLKNNQCEHDHSSTHGIQIETWEDGDVTYNIWDFGGQEVYHGTHRLFMSSEAIQLILFTPDVEEKARNNEQVKDRIREDMILPHTVEYWYETIKTLSPNSTFLMVQNKKDKLVEVDEIARKYATESKMEFRHISAKEGDGIKHLRYFLKDFAEEMPEYGMYMPQSWIKVRQFFTENLKKENNEKIITQQFFEKLCEENKVSKRTWDLLKRYLHSSGYIYYHKNLEDKIIADQKWALEAIYRPLDRNADHYEELKEEKGKIRVRRLFQIFGEQYTKEEKWLFLQFLKSCSLCFKLNLESSNKGEDLLKDVYLFPEFLNDDTPEIVNTFWERMISSIDNEVLIFRYKLKWLNYHIMQQFITTIGAKVEERFMWRTGIYVPTSEGDFRIELDKEGKAIILSIERKAVNRWLKVVLEELGGRIDNNKWEIQLGDIFEPFKWGEQGMNLPKIAVKEVEETIGEEDQKGFNTLPDRPHKFDKKTILFIAANPSSNQKLSSQEKEHSLITRITKKHYEVYDQFAASAIDMNDLIIEYEPTIVHFCGHANEESLEMHDRYKRETKPLELSTITSFFNSIKLEVSNLELVFLNACLTENLAKSISENNIQTIGTVEEFDSVYAIPFASGFYKRFIKGDNLEKSVRHGIRECELETDQNLNDMIAIFKDGKQITI